MSTSSMMLPLPSVILPKANVYGCRSCSLRLSLPTGVKMLSAMEIASGPETLIIPNAPPGAVAMAQIVFCLFIFLLINLQMYVFLFNFAHDFNVMQ